MYTNIFYYFLLTFKLFFSAFTITNAIAGSIFLCIHLWMSVLRFNIIECILMHFNWLELNLNMFTL